MNDDKKRVLVLKLFALDVQVGLDAAVAEKRQDLTRFVEGVWDKTMSPSAKSWLSDLQHMRNSNWQLRNWVMQTDSPTGWSVNPLEKVATLQRGFDLPIQNREKGQVPVYGSNGIDGWHNQAAVSGPGVITGRSGTIGAVYFEPGDYWPLNTTLYVRDFHGNEPKFITRLLEDLDLRRFSASTGVPSLNRNFVHPTPVLVPPLDEQRRIAVVLDTADEAIAKTEAVIAKLKQVRAGLLHDLLTCGLEEHGQVRDPVTHPEQFQDSPFGRIPREWDTGKFEQLASVIDPQPDHRAPPEVVAGEPYIGVGDFLASGDVNLASCRRVSLDALAKQQARFRIEQGDILFGKIGTIGVPRLLPATHKAYALNANTVLIKPVERSNYVCWLLNSHIIESQITADIHSTSQPAFGIQKIRALIAPNPAISERERIGRVLDACEEAIREESAELSKLHKLKYGLVTDLLTGRVRVPVEIKNV